MPWLNRFDPAWLRAISAAHEHVFVLEDHSPVGGLGDALRRELGPGRRRLRRRGLAGMRNTGRGARVRTGSTAPRSPRRIEAALGARDAEPVWLVLPDQLTIRLFFEAGIVRAASRSGSAIGSSRLPGRRGGPGLGGARAADRSSTRTDLAPVRRRRRRAGRPPRRPRRSTGSSATTRSRCGSTTGTASTRERMTPGHPNWMLDSSRDSRLPRWELGRARDGALALRRAALRAARALPADASRVRRARALERAAARRRAVPRRAHGGSTLPIVAHVASWDHTVGKGVIAPFCDRVRRPERGDARRPRAVPRHRAASGSS